MTNRYTRYQYDSDGVICAKVTTDGSLVAGDNGFLVKTGTEPHKIFDMVYDKKTKSVTPRKVKGLDFIAEPTDLSNIIVEK